LQDYWTSKKAKLNICKFINSSSSVLNIQTFQKKINDFDGLNLQTCLSKVISVNALFDIIGSIFSQFTFWKFSYNETNQHFFYGALKLWSRWSFLIEDELTIFFANFSGNGMIIKRTAQIIKSLEIQLVLLRNLRLFFA
jgi:hypothetical protein